jgi:hypothetical protein
MHLCEILLQNWENHDKSVIKHTSSAVNVSKVMENCGQVTIILATHFHHWLRKCVQCLEAFRMLTI